MKRVAILGGGPAGAFAAAELSGAGLSTVVLDEKLAWEKSDPVVIAQSLYFRCTAASSES